MTDTPDTIRDGWISNPDIVSWDAWSADAYDVPPEDRHPDVAPCLVVTGDLAAARARLAPIPADVRTRAIDAAAHALDGMQEPGEYLAARAVDALCAAGLIRLPADDDAVERAAARLEEPNA